MDDKLFMLRIGLTNKAHGNYVLAVTAFDANHTSPQTGHMRIDVQARLCWTENGKRRTRTIWKRGQTYCAVNRYTAIDGDDAKELVCSLLSMKPGDTDSEFFEGWTEEQIALGENHGDAISCAAEYRYGTR